MFFLSSKSYLDLGDLDFVHSGVPERFKLFKIMQGISYCSRVLPHGGRAIPKSSFPAIVSADNLCNCFKTKI